MKELDLALIAAKFRLNSNLLNAIDYSYDIRKVINPDEKSISFKEVELDIVNMRELFIIDFSSDKLTIFLSSL